MAKYPLNLGSTFNEFLNALNTNTEDTEGIIEGTKKVKKLSLGEGDDEKGSLEYNIENNVTNVLLKGQSATLQSNPHEQGWGSKIVCDKGLINLFADSDITIRADKGAFTRFYNDITFNEANIVGKVDFSNATVTGLPSSGGLDIPSEVINYDSENQQLNIYSPNEIYFEASEQINKMQITKNGISFSIADESAFFNFGIDGNDITACSFECERIDFISGNVNFSGEVDFSNATVIGLPTSSGGGLDTTADITWEGDHKFNGNVSFYGEVDFTNATISSNNLFVLDNDNTIHGETDYQAPVIFNSDVDFTNANVVGLPSGGGSSPLAIQVNELPIENIDNSKVYIVAENPQVYIKVYTSVLTLENFLQGSGVTNPVLNYHVVPTLPTEGEVTDFVTMTPMHCYINSSNGIAYFYGNLGAGNMWVNAAALFAQVTGSGAEDAGRTYSISDEPTELTIRIYTYWEDVQYVYTINNQWCKVNYSNGFNPDNDYTFTGRNSFEGSTHLKNSVIIGDVDSGKQGTVHFFTEQVTFHRGKVTFNNGHESDIDGGVEFYGKVDFTNADVTGLLNFNSSNTFDEEIIILNPNGEAGGSIKYNPIGNNPTLWLPDENGTLATQEWVNSQGSSGGLTQEEVQEMINTAINGALEGSY